MRTTALALLFLVAACQSPPPEMTDAEMAQIEAEVVGVAEQFMTGLNNLDPGVAAALYDHSSMHGNDGAAYFATYDEWVAHNEEFFARFEDLNGGWTDTRVDVLAPDVALVVGQNEMAVTQVTGARTNIHGYITLVMRKTDGAWKVIHQASTGRWTPVQ